MRSVRIGKIAGDENVVTLCRNVQTGVYRQLGDLKRAGETLAQFEADTAKRLPTLRPMISTGSPSGAPGP